MCGSDLWPSFFYGTDLRFLLGSQYPASPITVLLAPHSSVTLGVLLPSLTCPLQHTYITASVLGWRALTFAVLSR